MEVPIKVRGVLGKLFDREVGALFGVSTQTVQLWRTSLGIDPVCKACRLAVREGRTNTCSSHSDLGASRRAEAKAKWPRNGATIDELMEQYKAANERAYSVGKRLELLLQYNPHIESKDMNPTDPIPPVNLFDLIPDRCNYKDRTFESAVTKFMTQFMPGFSTCMLEREDHERWEIVDDVSAPTEVTFSVEIDADGQRRWSVDTLGVEDEDALAWSSEHLPYPADEEDIEVRYCVDLGGDVEWFETEGDAEDAATEHAQESRYGHPWAQYWGFMPEDLITNEELGEAGFTVAYYTGGDGDRYRLCGIDGGGYSFSGAHFALLYAIVHENRTEYGWKVDTDKGQAYITTKRPVSPANDNLEGGN